MTREEYNQMRLTCYKNYIGSVYGKDVLEKFNLAINPQETKKLLKMRTDEEFNDYIEKIKIDGIYG